MKYTSVSILVALSLLAIPVAGLAQAGEGEEAPAEGETPAEIQTDVGEARQTFVGKTLAFDVSRSQIPEGQTIQEVLWDFGDGVKTTGEKVSHAYSRPGKFTVTVTLTTESGQAEDTTEVEVFQYVAVLIADQSAPDDQLELRRQQAAEAGLLLLILKPRDAGSEVIAEDQLTRQLIDARDAVAKANSLITWTSGSVGSNILSQFAQRVRETNEFSLGELNLESKSIIMLSDTPFGVLAPTAQSVFDQLQPAYVLLVRPQALELLTEPKTAEEIQATIVRSPIEHRLLGAFSARAVSDIGPTNFFSFGINFLINRGIAVNSIILILMLPVIATILSFSRQVIGIKAFGIITPAMTTLSFLVIGIQYGLIIFLAVLLAGTLTRLVLRGLHLLYLPRMALVLTSVSLAVLILFGLGVASDNAGLLSFSIFPVLILTLLAEEFISVQFSSGARQAFTITAWTLALSIACYYIVSWELLRTTVLSYPEVILLAIPFNIIIGRFSGLRVTEYFRFRRLLRHTT